MPYALSGDNNVRGFRDRYDRGDQFLGGNAEVRRKVIETKHIPKPLRKLFPLLQE